MSESKNYNKAYSAEDIRRYLSGKMTREEMYAIERASLNDPFLADALEGYKNISEEEADADMRTLDERLKARAIQKVVPIKRINRWWRIAAAAIVILGAGFASYFLITSPAENTSIAQRETVTAKDSGKNDKQFSADSALVNPPLAVQSEKDTNHGIHVEKEEKTGVQKTAKSERALVDEPAHAFTDVEKKDAKSKSKPVESKENELTEKAPEPKINKPKAEDDVARTLPAAANDKKAISPSNAVSANYFRGQVVDANNGVVPFANISIQGTGSNSYADAKGNFSLVSADSVLNVEIKSVGYLSKNFTLNADSVKNRIVMQSKPSTLGLTSRKNNPKSKNDPNQKAEAAKASADEAVTEAEPIDGWGLYQLYLLNNVRIPFEARQSNLKGVVELSFLVHEKGELSDFRIEKSLCSSCDKEAIRLVKEGPKWELNFGKKAAKAYVSVVF